MLKMYSVGGLHQLGVLPPFCNLMANVNVSLVRLNVADNSPLKYFPYSVWAMSPKASK